MGKENYKGNPNLKASNVQLEYSREQAEEYIKCARDYIYFVRTYMKIVNVDKGLILFDMYPFQERMITTFAENRFVINKLPRQSGKSTVTIAYLLWLTLFTDQQSIAILANKGQLARDLLSKYRLAYEYLPKWLQQGVVVWNKGNIELENGSKIAAGSTSSSSIRGGSYNLIFLDEFAFINQNMAEDFFASTYPTISSGQTTKVIIVSTPNGMNHFYKMWVDATEKRSLYVPIEIHWSEVPGRDAKWKEETIKNTSETQFLQEFECEFIGSVNTLISSAKLRTLVFKKPLRDVGHLQIYEEPAKDKKYVISVDTGRGVERDYSAFIVFDVTEIPYKMVAKFRSHEISPMLYPNTIYNVAKNYNDAFAIVEINDVGAQVADILHHDLEYENILITSTKGGKGQQIGGGFGSTSQLGVRTNKQVKRIGCSNFKDLIEHDKLLVSDYDLIVEMSNFIGKGSSYEADDGQNDDLVMCCVLFSWLVRQPYFKDLTDSDIREKLYSDNLSMFESDLLPFGMIEDGQPEEEVNPYQHVTNWLVD